MPYDSDYEARKAAAIARVLAGEFKTTVSQDTGFDRGSLRRWSRELERDKPSSAYAAGMAVDDKRSAGLPHEEEHKTETGRKSIVLVIPDLHSPAIHQDALTFLQAVKARFKPNVFLQLGDEVDFQSLSRFPHNPDMYSAGTELSAAIEGLIPFYKEFPKMKVCVSNHTTRAARAAFGAGIPKAFLKHISMVLNAPDGWEWADEFFIDDVMYLHGDRGKSGQHAHIAYLKGFKRSIVIGHLHANQGKRITNLLTQKKLCK